MPSIADPRRAPQTQQAPSVPAPGPSGTARVVPRRGNRATTVVVVDPIPLFVEGLRAAFARTPSVRILGATANPHAALALCERTHPDVVLVDALLDPHCQFNRMLGAATSTAAMLCVVREPLRTTRYLTSALSAGVAGFVPRSAEPARMLEALRRTHLQRRFLDPELATLANSPGLRAVAGASSASSGAPHHHRQPLSRREHEVLGLICDGLENQEIATALFVSVETIRTHVKSILRKLRARDRAHAVALAFRLGLLVPGSADTSPAGGPATSADASADALPAITPRSGHEHVARPSLARVTSR